ncbi:MAG: tRNA guanosine(34) transglycosylase Tgt [Bacteroidetes bacterium RIFCSPLOWO2_02_FULL_36_8]|nr:MAG: tRNA guanosine(34) transglycosylase Tgt [Bacteroidetes bacterium RIFCSPLOWO2_02_FULL_36_8]OFY71282.1 MAG: tRNA guanosine(34) transglycosylase Tgt [Bacteroidetes bacterium RIFCSPLOWO2_12_FULL_37_12]
MFFKNKSKDPHSSARTGEIHTAHGIIQTPVFMPVGTGANVKSIHFKELKDELRSEIMLCNTYHLYLRPGTDVMQKAGGIHAFTNWKNPILTDSGGFQIFSLTKQFKISEEGAEFRSHIDGSKHFFSPESVVDIQRKIGADILMAFDECPSYQTDFQSVNKSMELTHRWLDRNINAFHTTENHYKYDQHLFPIIQGGIYPELRRKSAELVAEKNLPGNAIGGLSVGEPVNEMYSMTKLICEILPQDKPRYLMGVGTPENILECISYGVDMFDCVLPTRNGRHGLFYTCNGIINIKNEKWKNDFSPLNEQSELVADRDYSKAFVRHLFMTGELLGAQIGSLHNLNFYFGLMRESRKHIENGDFVVWKDSIITNLGKRL